jgi:hypothetical protein
MKYVHHTRIGGYYWKFHKCWYFYLLLHDTSKYVWNDIVENKWIRSMNRTSSPKLSNAKFDCTIVTGSSRRTKRIYHMYTSELGWKRYAQDKITPLTSRGPSGIHIRPHGDTLPLWMPCVHYISSIQKKHSLTNQTMPRVQHKDLWAHNLCKPPQNNVYTWNRQNGPHVSLPEKAQR